LHSDEYPSAHLTFLTNTVEHPYTFWPNRILNITQAYWDVSGAEAVIETIQKLFSNLSYLEKVAC